MAQNTEVAAETISGDPSAEKRRIAHQNWLHYQRARDAGFLKYVTEAQRQDDFFLGRQWDEALQKELEGEGKPCLTLNLTMPAVLAALGRHSAQRVDPDLKPRQDADEDTARVMTHVVDYVFDENHYQQVEGQVLSDGLIQDRGFFDIRMDYETNVMGDIRLRALDPVDVLPDPDAKDYDPRKWNEVIYTRWHTVDEIEQLYGKDKADTIRTLAAGGITLGYDSIRLDVKESRFGDTQYPIYVTDDYQAVVRNVRVIERQHRILTKVRQFVDLATGDIRTIPSHWDEAKIQTVSKQYGLGIRKALVRRVRWTVTCDWVVLYDDWSPYEEFTIVPYFPVFRRGKSSGMVKQLISPQEQLNKVESQSLHVINTTANSGWIAEEGSIANMTTEELENRGAETGLVLITRKGRERPEKIQPNQIPSGLDRAGTKAASYVREISGVQSLMGVMPSSEVSGVTLENTQQAAVALLQVAFDNLDYTRQLVVEKVIDLIQNNYNEPRIFKVTDWRSPETPNIEVQANMPDATGKILNDLTVGKYSVVIATMPLRDGIQDSQFAEAVQLREAGVVIPDEYVIQYSHLAQKKEIAAVVKQMQGRGDPTTEEAQMQQIQQQLVLKRAMAEIDEIVAKAQERQSNAQLHQAKAGVAVHDAQAGAQMDMLELMLKAQGIKAQLATAMAKNETSIALADRHIAAKNQNTLFQAGMKDKENQLHYALEHRKIDKSNNSPKGD